MGQTLANADAVLKDDYQGPVNEQLNNANVLLAEVERNTKDFTGRRALLPLHVGRNKGVGNRAERGTLPTPGNQQYDDIFIPVRYSYVRISLTGPVIEQMAKSRGSFIRAIDSEMDGAVTDAKRDYTRQLWGTSDGVLATCGTTTDANEVVLASTTPQHQLEWLYEGFAVDIGTTGDSDTVAAAREVLDVDFDAKTITIDGDAITTTGSHIVSRAGAYGVSTNTGNPGDGQIELTGIQTMVSDTTTLHTLAPATEPRWKSQVYANSGTLRGISENLVSRALMTGEKRSGKIVKLLACNDGVHRTYTTQLNALRRMMNPVELKGGYEGITVSVPKGGRNGSSTTALVWDRDCPSNSIYGLSTDDLVFYDLVDWEWDDRTGSIWERIGDTDDFVATMRRYGEFACRRRNSHFVIKDIREDA
ncbi:MAG: phage major capsid protein [Solirubrobacteraceae bacterium]